MEYELITIGKYNITKIDDKLWIVINNTQAERCGEGGEFKEAELEKAIDRFYDEKF